MRYSSLAVKKRPPASPGPSDYGVGRTYVTVNLMISQQYHPTDTGQSARKGDLFAPDGRTHVDDAHRRDVGSASHPPPMPFARPRRGEGNRWW